MAETTLANLVRSRMRDVPDFPTPGVLFKDFSPLLADPDAFSAVVDDVATRHAGTVDVVAGIEARGFILGTAAALRLGVGLVPIRKAGKLPPPVHAVDYALEYGAGTLEVSTTGFRPGARVLVIDDVLATGGTAAAACDLVERSGAVVSGLDFILELSFLDGRARLPGRPVHSLLVV